MSDAIQSSEALVPPPLPDQPRLNPPSPRSGYRLPIGKGRPKGAKTNDTLLKEALKRARKRNGGVAFLDLFVDLAYRSASSVRFPQAAISLRKALVPDRTFNEADRAPQQIIFIDRIPDKIPGFRPPVLQDSNDPSQSA